MRHLLTTLTALCLAAVMSAGTVNYTADDNTIFANPETADLEKWKDIGPLLKKNLVGKTSEIVRAVEKGKGNWSFESVKENGKPVVRPLTAEDIDALGPICNTIVTGIVEEDPAEK